MKTEMSNFTAFSARIKKARTTEELRKLEKSLNRLYETGFFRVSEMKRLDVMLMEAQAVIDTCESQMVRPIDVSINLTIHPGDVWRAGCGPGKNGPTLRMANGTCVVLGETAKQIFEAEKRARGCTNGQQ